jgi:molybdopterin-synthase adenylyltransferase
METHETLGRYARQILLPGWTVATQQKLTGAKVFVAGAGGLGCPVAVNLAVAGVGTIRLCDADVVAPSNFNRQFLHKEQSIHTNKAISAHNTLSAVNSEITVEPISERITEDNVDDLIGDCQIIVDCLDNFPARIALNRCSIRHGIPMVHGTIWGMEGRLTFFHPPETPCFECMFCKAPPQGDVPVLGAATSAIGSLQALETIKHLTGMGRLLKGRMVVLDGSAMEFQELTLEKDPQCTACGKHHRNCSKPC